jgi:hypothetical protein
VRLDRPQAICCLDIGIALHGLQISNGTDRVAKKKSKHAKKPATASAPSAFYAE